MIWLLLLASLANAQEVSTGAATSLLDEVRISNLGKDTRDLLSGRYRQTGKPTFANGFCFADGTCQTTAPVSGGMSLSSDNEMQSAGAITLANGSYIAINKNDGFAIDLKGENVAWAKSIDGATQSSGCVVSIGMSGTGPDSFLSATSTTTANLDFAAVQTRPAVLLSETCVPGDFCLYGLSGVYRVMATNTSYTPTGTVHANINTTRCKITAAGGSASSVIAGHFMSKTDASGNFWMKVGL